MKAVKTLKTVATLVLCFLLPCSCAALASGDVFTSETSSTVLSTSYEGTWVLKENENGEPYLYNEQEGLSIIASCRFNESGELVQVPITQDLADESNKTVSVEITSGEVTIQPDRAGIVIVDHFYTEEDYDIYTGDPIKVTPDVTARYGPSQPSIASSVSFSESFSVNVGVDADVKDTIRASVGAEWNRSATIQAGFSIPLFIPQGSIGHVVFYPKIYRTEGTLRTLTYNEYGLVGDKQEYVWGQYPVTIESGFPDGRFDVVITGSC